MARRATLNSRSEAREGSRRSAGKWQGYAKRTPDQIKKRAEQTGGRYDSFLKTGVDMFRPKSGDNTLRYLPPTWENPQHYGYDVWVHAYVGVDESSYLCPAKMLNKPCPICDAAKEAKDSGDEEEYKGLKPTNRVLAYVLDRDEEIPKKATPTPLIYSQSWSFDRDIAALSDTKGGALYIDHPEDGYDVTFKKRGQGLNTRYIGVQIDRDPSPICEDEKDQQAVLDLIAEKPIPDMLKFYPAEHLRKVIEGTSEQKDEDLDKDEDNDEGSEAAEDRRRGGRSRSRDEEEVEREEPRSRRARDEEEERPRRETRERVRPRDEEEEAPRERTHRGRDDSRDEEEERPRRGSRERTSGRRDEEDEERPARTTRSRDDEEVDRPSRGRRTARDEDEERPARRGREPRDVEDEEPHGSRGRRTSRDEEAEPEPEEEERPRGRVGRTRLDPDEEIPF